MCRCLIRHSPQSWDAYPVLVDCLLAQGKVSAADELNANLVHRHLSQQNAGTLSHRRGKSTFRLIHGRPTCPGSSTKRPSRHCQGPDQLNAFRRCHRRIRIGLCDASFPTHSRRTALVSTSCCGFGTRTPQVSSPSFLSGRPCSEGSRSAPLRRDADAEGVFSHANGFRTRNFGNREKSRSAVQSSFTP